MWTILGGLIGVITGIFKHDWFDKEITTELTMSIWSNERTEILLTIGLS